jgi:hypothetical protein
MSDTEPVDPLEPPDPPPEPGEPVPFDPFPTSSAGVGVDAPLSEKAAHFAPTLGTGVTGPGQAETAAAVSIGDRTAVRGQHNWVPIGPRNVGGRVRAVAVEPGDSRVMYAAPAAGGVFKSTDGGDSWFPLWHDEPSLSMAALALSGADPAVVWAGTGETQAGGGETIPAAGVWRSPDRGKTWTHPVAGETILNARIHALAAHPTNSQVCWAAAGIGANGDNSASGLYRTTDGGQHWTTFASTRGFTDVRFATLGGSLRLFAVLERFITLPGPPPSNRAVLIRLDTPDDPDATLSGILDPSGPPDPLLSVGTPAPAQPAGFANPGFGKIAIYDGSDPAFPNPVLYLALTHEDRSPPGTRVDRSYTGIFRCRDAHTAAATTMTFTTLPPAETFGAEGQGGYNIALAVSPVNPNHLAFGMVELYLHRNANAAAPAAGDWLRAQMWDLNIVDRGHHADHHDLLFAAAPPAPFTNGATAGAMVLWDGNDGGVSWCADWQTANGYPIIDLPPVVGDPLPRAQGTALFPPPLDTLTWRKRSHGISATQMYDLTQHPRLPSVIACGFQDNGAWLGLSGPSWQLALTADGGFVAFDPDDPYRMLVTYQSGITEARFPGRLRSAAQLPRDQVQNSLWPRELQDGFLDSDGAPFVAETVFHPRLPGRVVTARRHRLYGTRATSGDRWIPEPLGTVFEIVNRPAQRNAAFSVLEVIDTPGGRSIGLPPQRAVTVRGGAESHADSRVRASREGPYSIGVGTDLRLLLRTDLPGVAPVAVTVPLTVGPTLPASASAAQVASYLTSALPAALAGTPAAARPLVRAFTAVLPPARELVVAATASGSGTQVVLSGTAVGGGLDAVARAYHGADAGAGPGAAAAALPAIAPIVMPFDRSPMDLSGETLRVTREGGASQVDIVFDTELPPPASSAVTPSQLAAVLRARLGAAYEVWTSSGFRGVRLASTATPATNVTVLGNLTVASPGAARADLNVVPTGAAVTRRLAGRTITGRWFDTLDLTAIPPPPPPPPVAPTPRTLRVREGGNQTALQVLDAAFLAVTDVTRVTMVELCDAVRRMLAAAPAVRIRCDLEVGSWAANPNERRAVGEVSEVAFGPPGTRIAYAGDTGGRIYRSTDDGETWEHRPSVMDDHSGLCDAIAVRPDDPRTVLVGHYAEGLQPDDAVMLHRSVDGGATFTAAPAQVDNGQTGAARRVVGVRALVFDPGAPGHVYAATDLGVHHSPDAGGSWQPFNTGLPNVRVTDLALAEQTRVLRAGAWGRGVYERRLDPAGVRDVRLHIRTTALDDGTAQPAPGPDLLATLPASLRFDESPDIKVIRHDPRLGVVLDGVEFDDDLVSEDACAGAAFVAVQVHNRGAFPTPEPAAPPAPAGPPVRVTAFWAPADDGPPPVPTGLWSALANPVPAGTTFGRWTLVGDEPVGGPAGTGHETVAPGYPRVVVLGVTTPFAWPADIDQHARVGVIAITRSADDPLPTAPVRPTRVLDVIRTEAKVGYREVTVSPSAEDSQVVLRTLDGSPIAVVAVAGAENAANGGAPFGLAAVALPGAPDVRFATAGPYALPARRRFEIQVRRAATVTFAAGDPELPNLGRVFATDAANVINRALVAAGLPVRATDLSFPGAGNDALSLTSLSAARFTVAGNAATTFGLTKGAASAAAVTTPFASRGPWNLTPAAPRSLTVTATTTVEIRLEPGRGGLPPAGPFSAAAIRTSISRQLVRGGLAHVVCEPVRRRLSVRRSATETASGRQGVGSAVLADLVASPVAVPAGVARDALFDVETTHGQDTVAAAGNHFYLRVANIGNVREDAVRHRLLLVDTSVRPLTLAPLGAPVARALAAGTSAVVEFPAVAVAGVAAGDHRFVLAIADVDVADQRLDPAPGDLAGLESLLDYCVRHPGAALREFVGR